MRECKSDDGKVSKTRKPHKNLFKEALLTLYRTNKITATLSYQICELLLYKSEEVKRQAAPFQHGSNPTLCKRRRSVTASKKLFALSLKDKKKKGKVVVLLYGRFLKVITITIVATAIATMIAAVAASIYIKVDVSAVFTWVGSTVGDVSAIVKLVPALEE